MNEMRTMPKGKCFLKTHLSTVSGSSSPIISSSTSSPWFATVTFEAMLLRAFSRSESRYSCDTSSSPSSELSPPSDSSDSDSEEEYDEDGLEDADDGEGELENSARSTES